MRLMNGSLGCWLLVAAAGCIGQSAPADGNPAESSAPSRQPLDGQAWPEKIESKLLPNAFRLHEKVISGGQPDGAAAFAELAALGVKTVISVDGARPDVAAAEKFGLRYVHLPHGYGGIPEQRLRELAKAVRDLEGPIYIHCHHGKHRSPAAATVACIGAGLLPPENALTVLTVAGTGKNYRGLYAAAESARKIDEAVLNAVTADFPPTAELPPLAEAMVTIEHIHDRLKQAEAAAWNAPSDHPDIDPPHEALLLREQFTELLRTDAVQAEPVRFIEQMRQGEAAAQALQTALGDRSNSDQPTTAAIGKAFAEISSNCKICHQEFRDVPHSSPAAK